MFNKEYSKEAYHAKLKEFRLDTHEGVAALRQQAEEFWQTQPNKFIEGSSNEDVSGEYIHEAKNVHDSWHCRYLEDSRYCQNMYEKPARECYDATNWGLGAELIYESIQSGKDVYNQRFCWACWGNNRNLQYSMFCQGNSNLFGCISLRKKQYCILNKQYTEDEYHALVPKIIQQMKEMPFVDNQGREYRYGEFFPPQFSPSEYNVTIAQEHFPLGKAEAEQQGYTWYTEPARQTEPTMTAEELPQTSVEATESLAGAVIQCAHKGECQDECTTAFTIIPRELAFLIQQGIPLPRLCPNCRHYTRIRKRRGMALHQRQCQCAGQASQNGVYTNQASDHSPHSADEPCPNTFRTSFNIDSPDIVYCEDCYQREVT